MLTDLTPLRRPTLFFFFSFALRNGAIVRDRLRLVMPPALAVALAIPLNKLAHTLLAEPQAYAGISGLFFGYVLYDMCHYYLHHARPFKFHFKEMKTYHLKHHYGDYEGGYGITSKIWDK